MKTYLLFLAFTCLLFTQTDFEKYRQQQQQAFQDFLSKEDKAFIGFLKSKWIDVDLEKPKEAFNKPKPKTLPSLVEAPKLDAEPKLEKPAPIVKPVIVIPPEPEAPKPLPRPNVSPKKAMFNFNYYGREEQAPLLSGIGNIQLKALDNASIAEFWKSFAETEKGELSNDLKTTYEDQKLSDYEIYVYTYRLAKSIYRDENVQHLATWYLLTKLGYNIKVGYSEKQIYLLIPMKEQLYSLSYFSFQGDTKPYFAFTPESKSQFVQGRLKTYSQNYPNANKTFSFFMDKTPKVSSKTERRDLTFNYEGKSYNITLNYNRHLVDFYTFYPQTDFDLYVMSEPSTVLRQSVLAQLQPILAGKSETEAANMLIRFVQTAFTYQTDDQQFKREKFLFVDETIFYPASDCEDRSILFAYLVRNLLGLDVIGLSYPGHIATAVLFREKTSGDHIVSDGKQYLICDPTYINANIGMAMPQFKTVAAKVIQL
jgi:hypothetical protein